MQTIGDLTSQAVASIRRPSCIRRQTFGDPPEELIQMAIAFFRQSHPWFVVDDANRFAVHNALRWLFGLQFQRYSPREGVWVAGDINRGLYIQGGTGTGKSVLLKMLNYIAAHEGITYKYHASSGAYYTASMADIQDNYLQGSTIDLEGREAVLDLASRVTDDYASRGDMERYKHAPMLMIQDLGQEPIPAVYMGNRVNTLEQIITHRGDQEGMITSFTSNVHLYLPNDAKQTRQLKDIRDYYGDRVQDRLMAMCNVIPLYGQSRRK